MAVTIKDIAEMARVSKGTVSRVLNGGPGVSEETRKRILRLIKELDYQPNASARGLAASRTNNIGVIIPHTGRYSMSTVYWPHLLTSVTEQAAAREMNIVVSTARTEKDVDSAYRSILKGRKVDGLIIGGYQFGERQMAELLLKDFPYVMIGKSPYNSGYYVDVDNVEGARAMTAYILALGHRNIALLAGPEQFVNIQERVEGFRLAMREAGLNSELVYRCTYDTESVVQRVKEILSNGKTTPTALFAVAGDLAVGTLQAVHELGLKIPDDVGLAFFDDHPFFECFSPRITAVRQPIEELGKNAVDILFNLLDGKKPAEKSLILPTRLIIRESCGGAGTAAHIEVQQGKEEPGK